MRSIAVGIELVTCLPQRLIVSKGAQQLVMTGARCVRARDDRVNDPKPRGMADALRRDAETCAHAPVARCRVLERAHDRGANGYDAATVTPGAAKRKGGRCGNAIGFVERQASIELGVTGGRDT